MAEYKILIIAELEAICKDIQTALVGVKSFMCEVTCVFSFDDAATQFGADNFDLAVLDFDTNKELSAQFLTYIQKQRPELPVIMLVSDKVAYADVDIDMHENGFDDFWYKEKLSQDVLERSIRYAIEKKETGIFNRELQSRNQKLFSLIVNELAEPVNMLTAICKATHANELDLEKLKSVCSMQPHDYASIVEKVALWSDVEFGESTLKFKALTINKIIDKNIRLLKPYAKAKSIELLSSVVKDVFVKSDQNILDFVLKNLIDNALKYTYLGGSVFVDCQIKMDSTIISVKDTGVGMSQEQVDLIMQRNTFRSTIGTLGEKGAGLGLEICIELIELVGGEFWLESQQGKGSTFYFSLP